jgi:hypothetical protein
LIEKLIVQVEKNGARSRYSPETDAQGNRFLKKPKEIHCQARVERFEVNDLDLGRGVTPQRVFDTNQFVGHID